MKIPFSRLPGLLARIVLTGLAALLLFSGVQHLMMPPELRQHYREVGFGEWGSIYIGILQVIAGIGLLWNRFRRLAATILAVVMLAAFASNLRHDFTADALIPLTIAVAAALAAFVLWREERRPPVTPAPETSD